MDGAKLNIYVNKLEIIYAYSILYIGRAKRNNGGGKK